MKKNVPNALVKTIARVFDKVLSVEANTSSCSFVYQPKAPKELKQFRREK